MKLVLSIWAAVTALYSQGGQGRGEFAAGQDYYMAAGFRKAAARFQPMCNINNDADACYWVGRSYERLADSNAKAHEYLAKAARLAPDRTRYRVKRR